MIVTRLMASLRRVAPGSTKLFTVASTPVSANRMISAEFLRRRSRQGAVMYERKRRSPIATS